MYSGKPLVPQFVRPKRHMRFELVGFGCASPKTVWYSNPASVPLAESMLLPCMPAAVGESLHQLS